MLRILFATTRNTGSYRAALVGLLIAALAAFTFGAPVSLANADTSNVQNEFSLRTALLASPAGTVTLGSHVTVTNTNLIVASDATLDLNNYELKTKNIIVNAGVTLTIRDSGGAGKLSVDADGAPGIQTTAATLIIQGGDIYVSSTGGHAGIGGAAGVTGDTGGNGGNGGTTIIDGGIVNVYGSGAGIGGGNAGNGTRTDSAGTGVGDGGRGGHGGVTTIRGGIVTLHGTYGAGIGGGQGGASQANLGGAGGDGGTTTITGGVVTVEGSRGAGIGGGQGGNTLGYTIGGTGGAGGVTSITGGNVSATGTNGAGVGGGQGGGSLFAIGGYGGAGGTMNIDNGTLTAMAMNGAGVGGGDGGFNYQYIDVLSMDGIGGAGAAVQVGAGATVSASRSDVDLTAGAAIGAGEGSSRGGSGSLHVDGTVDLPLGQLLRVGGGAAILGSGTITGEGTISNGGSITPQVPYSVTVTGNNFTVTFDSGSSQATPRSQSVRVLAKTFTQGARTFPGDPAITGNTFTGWTMNTDGSGGAPTVAMTLTGDLTVYGQWAFETYELAADTTTPLVGDPVTFTVTAEDGDPAGDLSGEFTFTANTPDAQITDNQVTFTAPGSWTVTATHSVSGMELTSIVTAGVDRTAPATISLALSATTVDVDGTLTATVTGTDAWGNALGDLTDLAAIASNHPSDVIGVDGSIHFPTPGEHTITATIGSASDSRTVTVIPESYTMTADVAAPLAGGTVTFTIIADDGDPAGDLASDFVFVATNASHTVSGNPATFTIAGDWIVTATHSTSGTHVSLPVTVGVDRTAPATISLVLSATTVNVGGTITATVTGADAWGNALGDLTDLAIITSDHPSDVIGADGSIHFPSASVHLITATMGDLSHAVEVTVVPAALPNPGDLALSGADPTSLITLAVILLLIGSALLSQLLRIRRAS